MTAEYERLQDARDREVPWRRWGPYLSERQWGTVREDYSEEGNAWGYFSHDQARSRVYRWGEDGLAGVSDDRQRLCFALALWNGADPILKERLFGLTNNEGNHGEDVKEYYFYLDSTPTHSYMKYLYKYPQSAYPYNDLVQTNRTKGRDQFEYELIDTGIFDGNRYFDVFVEYAKASPEDLLVQITVHNRGADEASIHLLPTAWFRNTWANGAAGEKPQLKRLDRPGDIRVVESRHEDLGVRYLYVEGEPELLFTDNETNTERLFGQPNASRFVKDGVNDFVVGGRTDAVNSSSGTKVAAHYQMSIEGGGMRTVRLRLTDTMFPADQASAPKSRSPFGAGFDDIFSRRRQEADEFYATVAPAEASEDARNVLRQALAGMLWSKQYYYFDLDVWLEEHHAHPLGDFGHVNVRNRQWFHMNNDDVISMPDKWEYPWFAAWDLAFHTLPLAMVDIDFAKSQLDLMLREMYLHPNGQIPAYEWNFSDVNPPVHAWATLFMYSGEEMVRGSGDLEFLKHAFQKLVLNFTWWVNRKDPGGKNVFEGGFLGLDNIGVFDRSSPLPTGGRLEQADGTGWMALFSQNMLEIALVLAAHDPAYEPWALKFVEHFLWIAAAMDRVGDQHDEMWDEEDGFFYDVLRLPNERGGRLRVRSMVGLLPLCATTVVSEESYKDLPLLKARVRAFLQRFPALAENIAPLARPGVKNRRLLSALNENKLRRVLAKLLDEGEFLSDYGIRSVSRFHGEHPYTFSVGRDVYGVAYEPAESTTGMFGGNSNWRGPIWFPVNLLIIRALLQFYSYYGNDFTVECPTGSGKQMTLYEVARTIANRLTAIFLRDSQGRRPVYGGTEKFQTDPHWRDHILFYEYFHGDNGAGLGASHQTGWTGVVARLIQAFTIATPDEILEHGVRIATARSQVTARTRARA